MKRVEKMKMKNYFYVDMVKYVQMATLVILVLIKII
jgi:hypothetical protein